ncbi:MAG TPA: polysaccharide deacetylase family protein [Caldisericia bacterium]|jgi:peptidoglycan/xylan/chitin deacetylase (PgdA/CDA1 family)|nr:polysaccharide deacetylase family protein [Caldisericia bacterium]HXK51268.1 polysaccharide deacetylase family protein [Caldisericia bacterium]
MLFDRFKIAISVVIVVFSIGLFIPIEPSIASGDLQIMEPSPGEVISGFIPVVVKANSDALSLSLKVIDTKGHTNNYFLSYSDHFYRINLNTKSLPNGSHYLYVVQDDSKTILDSPVTSVVIDNTQPSLQAGVSSKLVRSGTSLTIFLDTTSELENVDALIDDHIQIAMQYSSEEQKWITRFFVPYTMTEGSHVIKIICKDSKGSIVQSDVNFMICNSEPFFTYPSTGLSVLTNSIVLKGTFSPGSTLYLYRKSPHELEYIEELKTDHQGDWVSQSILLNDGLNTFSVHAKKDSEPVCVFPSQQVAIQYYSQGLVVLNYHDICKDGNVFSRSPDQFKADMEYLLENDFQFVSPTLYLSHIEGRADLPPKPVLITFDDGLKGVYTYAYPVLKELGLSGFFFLLVSRVGTTEHYVSWDECMEMQSSRVFSIESHTLNSHYFVDDTEGRHAALISRMPLPDGTVESVAQYSKRVSEDLLMSKQIIEEKIQKKVHFLAIPFGYGNNDLNKIVRNQGYKGTFNSGGGVNTLPLPSGWSIKRITIRKNDDLSEILF